MNECRYIFGCALESKLEPGQCFIRYQTVGDDGKPLENPEFKTFVGQVIVTKNPWYNLEVFSNFIKKNKF